MFPLYGLSPAGSDNRNTLHELEQRSKKPVDFPLMLSALCAYDQVSEDVALTKWHSPSSCQRQSPEYSRTSYRLY